MMNSRRGFKRIAITVAAVAAFMGGAASSITIVEKRESAEHFLKNEEDRFFYDYAGLDQILDRVFKTTGKYDESGGESMAEQARAELRRRAALSAEDSANEESQRKRWAEEKARAKARLDESRNGFWVRLSKPSLVALCVAAGLAGGLAGFSSTWLILWFGGLAIYRLISWLILGFCDDVNSTQVQDMKAR